MDAMGTWLAHRTRAVFVALFALAALNAYLYTTAPSQTLELSVLKAGKGTAFLVRTPHSRTILIDAGSDASVLRALGTTLPEWQRTLAAVVLTSPTQAAGGGLPDVLARYRTNLLLRSAALGSAAFERSLEPFAQDLHTGDLYRGDRLTLDRGIALDVLWPPQTPAALSPKNGALVLRLSYGKTSFLIEGDLDAPMSTFVESILPPYGAITLSSSTPPRTYVSDGERVMRE